MKTDEEDLCRLISDWAELHAPHCKYFELRQLEADISELVKQREETINRKKEVKHP